MSATAKQLAEFKSCRVCGKKWDSLLDFVVDPLLRVEGYQAGFTDPNKGLIMVTHCEDGCGTTLAVQAELLKDLYDGPEHLERFTGKEPCRRYCLQRHLLQECDVHCDMAWVRHALQWLRNHELPPHISN